MTQTPACDAHLLRWQGDTLEVTLTHDASQAGRAFLRTDIGGAGVRRREIIAANDEGVPPLEKAWRDMEMAPRAPGVWTVRVPLEEVGVFSGKCFFLPDAGEAVPVWPDGGNIHVKVMPARTRGDNAIYTVFPRQFGSFREVARRLDFIMGEMGFSIIQTLPVFPVPVTYAVMGEYGCPFAATDFFSVDPAMAEFDARTTPLDQFRELVDAVHARGGRLFIDLPANHTGWGSTLQTHRPEWFCRHPDGRFVSPGAWGVVWEDLVALDYRHAPLRAYMADVFLFWTRLGVDGFRCDAGYMIPAETWTYIVARVREEYPETVFLLEGLGGKCEVTDDLLSRSGLDWAYSEIFQTYDRDAFAWYLPQAVRRARERGALVHFAETHDNDRLAKRGMAWARLRVALAALLSHQGAWGITNGVEWYATEKIDVHGKNDLNWGASENMVAHIARLNAILRSHEDFAGNPALAWIPRGPGNFLAVLRGSTLILANLDCQNAVHAAWDTEKFPCGACYDLLQGGTRTLEEGICLAPGECLCLSRKTCRPTQALDVHVRGADGNLVEWRYPEDLTRIVSLPVDTALCVRAPYPFRAEVKKGPVTLAQAAARAQEGAFAAVLAPRAHAGEGTYGEMCTLALSVFAPDGAKRAETALLLAPAPETAAVKLRYTGASVRADPSLESVLSNGAGACARVRLAWGEIASQYDAILAANTHPSVPAERLVLWTRCRAWLQYEGYSRAFNKDCLDSFDADPSGRTARWHFCVPCGLGRTARFAFTLSFAETAGNTAFLEVTYVGGDAPGKMRIVFRPDLEWRSFHGTTKAQGAVEQAFTGATAPCGPQGFRFSPYRADEAFVFTVSGGTCHLEGEWTYGVAHPEEAARGQEPTGDLYSPAWVACDFVPGATVTLTGRYVTDASAGETPRAIAGRAGWPLVLPLEKALREALDLFIVRRDDVKTVIAGYPWFLDWGRDTFIFLRGAIAAGRVREAYDIVMAFARFEEKGTLPNIIHGDTAGNRDTTDAPLWFVLAVRDLSLLMGREALLSRDCGNGRTLGDVVASIVAHYVDGTPNGIRMDPDSALVWSPSHFTWMDTNYPACTPRAGYPVEIQALWIAALRFLGTPRWEALAERAAASLVAYFDNGQGLADVLDAPGGEPAGQARRDDALRPNQLFALSLGALDPRSSCAREMVRATARLVVPGGIRSLDGRDARYRGVYAGDEDTMRKPAYHNGTVWAWPFPLHVEAAVATGALSVRAGLSLLASAVENLNAGCVAQISEIADGDAPHAQKGCRAQAWSTSELLRVWLQLSARQSV